MTENKYYLFLDETGDHGLSSVDQNFPIFLLCGCLVSQADLKKLESDVKKFKIKYFSSENTILHSSDIRKCEKEFQILFDIELKKNFYNDLNLILRSSNFITFGSAVKKEEHIKKYGKTAKDPYALCLSFVLERMIFCLDLHKNSIVKIIIEKRGKKEDLQLLAQYNAILDLGTYYVKSNRLKKKIQSIDFKWKKENVIGLQLADLVAYPVARSVLQPDVKYPTYEIIKSKIYCSPRGKIDGYGIKIFP